MTVSRVINGETSVRSQTRDAVNAAIASLNYSPNAAARNLQGSARSRIGLLCSGGATGFWTEFLRGTLEQAIRRDVQVVIEEARSRSHEREAASRLIGAGLDGVVLPSPAGEAGDVLKLFAAAGIPSISVGSSVTKEGARTIGIDDFEAARAMTRHILSLGHRRIAFIRGDPRLVASAKRYEGYASAIEGGGLRVEAALIADGLSNYRSGLDAAEALLELNDRPTAIFASSDDMAAASVAVAHRLAIDVPGALTVCGFGDTALATAIWPALTTIRLPIADMARDALEVLISNIRQPASTRIGLTFSQVVDFTLICRQSDAIARRRPPAERHQ